MSPMLSRPEVVFQSCLKVEHQKACWKLSTCKGMCYMEGFTAQWCGWVVFFEVPLVLIFFFFSSWVVRCQGSWESKFWFLSQGRTTDVRPVPNTGRLFRRWETTQCDNVCHIWTWRVATQANPQQPNHTPEPTSGRGLLTQAGLQTLLGFLAHLQGVL